ncbi:uncharacterized protein EKO05_0007446 [Ascochyta rabiei]|uniref:Uncharacterized protein n=1 Tax=Didymella rabiei TaxID=5454 RepID=A0A163ECY9_DIDRA|nr:uncharacterized protein EKO05_0007446 [Ascochyta rabiei]KZM23641.1 hypothetical protein ST47_g5231 [Ascochyta rabiei]UPX17070.1 hypothetical protein EKO05_0007446 [Ascochyta rabiei]
MAFLALPNELLQHIARFLPCSSLLQLIRVNRQIHTACYDQLVIKDIAQNALYNAPRAVDHLLDLYRQPGRVDLTLKQLGWPEGEALLEESSLEDKVRVAHAVEQMIRLSTLEPVAWLTATTSGIAEWLPHLLAMHHPAAWCLEPDVFLLPHGQLGQSNTSSTSSLLMNRWLSRTADQARDRLASTKLQALHFINFSFILNYTTLQRLGSTNTSSDILALFIGHFDPKRIYAQSLIGTQSSVAIVIQRLSERMPGYGTFIRDFTLTQASSALLLLLVAIAFTHQSRDQRFLPVPAKIPFSDFMDIPRIYRQSAELFTTCHCKYMTTPGFLSGRWMGYYSDHRRIDRMFYIDTPMQNIHMLVHEPTEEARTRLRISAVIDRDTKGYDAHGDFLLSGRVRKDGLVSIAKQYLGLGVSWTWTGRVTPFGIVGAWGNNSFGGYFWIFKEEWA